MAAKWPFAEFYSNWIATLSTTLLPQLRRALSTADVVQCLHPEWRTAVERPFLWLGDLHPYLFTNLLRSFLDDLGPSSPEDGGGDGFLDEYDVMAMEEFHHMRSWHVAEEMHDSGGAEVVESGGVGMAAAGSIYLCPPCV